MTSDLASKIPAPCGSWPSPLTVQTITGATVGLSSPLYDGTAVYWCESRPWEKGRTALVRWTDTEGAVDVTGPEQSVRSKVHEYGGRAYTVQGGTAFFQDITDGYLYRAERHSTPQRIETDGPVQAADLLVDASRDRLIAVTERTRDGNEPENLLIAIGFDGTVIELAQGADFYCAPTLSPDGMRLAWMEWDHPNMPWDESRIMEATLDPKGQMEGSPRAVVAEAGVSVFQPSYAPDGQLYYVSDRGGYWNLFRDGEPPAQFKAAAEFGLPHWQFGMRSYGFLTPTTAVTAFAIEGDWRLALFDLETGRATPIDLPWSRFDGLAVAPGRAVFAGARPDGPGGIVQLRFGAPEPIQVLKSSSDAEPPKGSVSIPERIAFPTENNLTAYAYYYAPANPEKSVPAGEKPPLIVMGHGGPTGQTDSGYSPKVQFWTTRGFAVCDVNYGGSTGFGREYRSRLNGNWGVVDVDDCCNAARYLAERGDVDPERLIIVGGSAGGYTTLSALAFRDVFKAGRSSYGIGDLETLARDTHKFESRYLDSLIGPWPEAKDVYDARSPLKNPDGLDCPVLFLQGSEDKVVPPNQAEAMVAVLKEKGVPVAYRLFEGEGHGFRTADSVKSAYLSELAFYGRIFGFTPADDVPELEIENL